MAVTLHKQDTTNALTSWVRMSRPPLPRLCLSQTATHPLLLVHQNRELIRNGRKGIPLRHLHKLEKYVYGRRFAIRLSAYVTLPFRLAFRSSTMVADSTSPHMVQIGRPGTSLRYAALAEAIASRKRVSSASFTNMSGVSRVSFAGTADPRLLAQWYYLCLSFFSFRIYVLRSISATYLHPRGRTQGKQQQGRC